MSTSKNKVISYGDMRSLDRNPDFKNRFWKFVDEVRNTLSPDLAYQYLTTNPTFRGRLLKAIRNAQQNGFSNAEMLLLEEEDKLFRKKWEAEHEGWYVGWRNEHCWCASGKEYKKCHGFYIPTPSSLKPYPGSINSSIPEPHLGLSGIGYNLRLPNEPDFDTDQGKYTIKEGDIEINEVVPNVSTPINSSLYSFLVTNGLLERMKQLVKNPGTKVEGGRPGYASNVKYMIGQRVSVDLWKDEDLETLFWEHFAELQQLLDKEATIIELWYMNGHLKAKLQWEDDSLLWVKCSALEHRDED